MVSPPRTSSNASVSIPSVIAAATPVAARHIRAKFTGPIIAAGGFTKETAKAILNAGDADLVAFGRPFISNPDLPRRFRIGAPLAAYDRNTFYGGDWRGFTDYPFYREAVAA